ncbi:MAG: alpha/beta fold hydrolase [Candidatus Melainabacteria bacterium]|nr:alpha/beta fold hydrolase [Candidatus Melainabacteria bacterium]
MKNKTIVNIALSLCFALSMPFASTAKVEAKASATHWSSTIKVPHRAWLPENKPKRVLLCVHGLGFSSESFSDFGQRMAAKGFAVYAVDVRGFGAWMKSRGEKAQQCDFEACLVDIENALKNIRKAYPGAQVYLVGESMGGAIALRATSRYPQLIDGLISSVPSNERYANLSETLKVGTRYLVAKDEKINIAPIVVKHATQDPKLQKTWMAEKTNRMQMTPKELKQFNDFMKGNYDAAALIEKTPVLMLAGFKDKLVKPEGTIELFNDVTCPNKILFVIGDSEHLLLEENQFTEQLASFMMTWINTCHD